MNLIDLALEIGLQPQRTAATNGGEYHSACPNCDGKDRFVFWPAQKQDKCTGRYWCRQCGISGDAITFCRSFLQLSWKDSIKKLGLSLNQLPKRNDGQLKKPINILSVAKAPSQKWKERAADFVQRCHQAALQNPTILQKFYERGFTDETIKKFKLGYCCNSFSSTTKDKFDDYATWGLASEKKDGGILKRLWLPHGLVIPNASDTGEWVKINIRRLDWHEGDKYGKYNKVKGGTLAPAIYGDINKKIAIILESELDAILIQQFASDFCFCIAVGGSTQPIDFYTDHLIRKVQLLLVCPDIDSAGAKFHDRLKETYQNAKSWPTPSGKSPGDYFRDHKGNLKKWILLGLPDALKPIDNDKINAFTCGICKKHDYWMSIFGRKCCMVCIDPNVDPEFVASIYPQSLSE